MLESPRVLVPETGQASVELVAAVPAVLAVVLVVWQLALTGHVAWLTANAARVAARAHAVQADPRSAARSALPRSLERGLRVDERDGRVSVRVRVPVILRRWRSRLEWEASARLGAR